MIRWLLRTSLKFTVDITPDASLRSAVLPDTVRGFEDLAFLFTSTPLDHGIAQLTVEEAAHLFRTVRDLGAATIVEIGRFRGGSTLVIAAAKSPGARLVSYDLHAVPWSSGVDLDADLAAALARLGLSDGVELVVGDSRTVEPPEDCALVFVDGDHSHAGVIADYEHWWPALRDGGHMLFHDALDSNAAVSSGCEPVTAALAQIDREHPRRLERVTQVGTIAHYVRTAG